MNRIHINKEYNKRFAETGVERTAPDRRSRPGAECSLGPDPASIQSVRGYGFPRGRSPNTTTPEVEEQERRQGEQRTDQSGHPFVVVLASDASG